MVSVDDMGQGNQSLRILGIRWLPSGAASRTVGADGNLEKADKNSKSSDRTDPQAAQEEDAHDETPDEKQEGKGDDKKTKQDEESEVAMREGMEAEEGDFVNLEMAIAYRSRATGKSMKAKAKNAHLFLKFYSLGGVAFPVWVEVRGFIATLRLRLQLTVSRLSRFKRVTVLLYHCIADFYPARPALCQSLHTDLPWTTQSLLIMRSTLEAWAEFDGRTDVIILRSVGH